MKKREKREENLVLIDKKSLKSKALIQDDNLQS